MTVPRLPGRAWLDLVQSHDLGPDQRRQLADRFSIWWEQTREVLQALQNPEPTPTPSPTPTPEPTGTPDPTGTPAPTETPEPTKEPDAGIFDVPELDVPPEPVGVNALGGNGVAMVTWVNPYRFYRNHARTRIYRARENRFGRAEEVGQSNWLTFMDEDVQNDTEYWYWVVFESQEGQFGPPSVAAPAQASVTNAAEGIVAQLKRELEQEPLADALGSDLRVPAVIHEEIQYLSAALALVSAGGLEIDPETLSVLKNELRIELRDEIAFGFTLGLPPNRFIADTRSGAQALRDRQGIISPEWLASYDADERHIIILEY